MRGIPEKWCIVACSKLCMNGCHACVCFLSVCVQPHSDPCGDLRAPAHRPATSLGTTHYSNSSPLHRWCTRPALAVWMDIRPPQRTVCGRHGVRGAPPLGCGFPTAHQRRWRHCSFVPAAPGCCQACPTNCVCMSFSQCCCRIFCTQHTQTGFWSVSRADLLGWVLRLICDATGTACQIVQDWERVMFPQGLVSLCHGLLPPPGTSPLCPGLRRTTTRTLQH